MGVKQKNKPKPGNSDGRAGYLWSKSPRLDPMRLCFKIYFIFILYIHDWRSRHVVHSYLCYGVPMEFPDNISGGPKVVSTPSSKGSFQSRILIWAGHSESERLKLFKSDFSIWCIMRLCHFPENRRTKKNLIWIGNLIDAR